MGFELERWCNWYIFIYTHTYTYILYRQYIYICIHCIFFVYVKCNHNIIVSNYEREGDFNYICIICLKTYHHPFADLINGLHAICPATSADRVLSQTRLQHQSLGHTVKPKVGTSWPTCSLEFGAKKSNTLDSAACLINTPSAGCRFQNLVTKMAMDWIP